MNKKEDAKEILVRAIKKGSKFARSMLAVELSAEADKLVVQGEYNDALAALTKASRLSDDTLIAQKRVLTLRLLGNVEEEYRTACLQILEKNPESVFALKQLESFYFQAGLKNIRRGMYPQAIVAFEKACEYHPMWGAALIKIGTCYEILRDTQKAFVNYSNSILDSSVMTEAKSSVARIYRGWKKYNQAFYVLQEGLDVQPSEIVLWDELGRLYRDLNKKNEFIECWKMKATLGDYTSYAELQGWGVKLDSIKFSLFPWLKKKPFAQSGDSWLSGDDPADFVPVDKPPVILEMATPEYPEFAKRIGAEGVVWVKILVGIDGLVAKALILKTDNEIFNVSAWEAAKRYKFSPAMKDNRPVAVWVSQPFRFKLTK